MSFLNLMKNKLKPKEVNDALTNNTSDISDISDLVGSTPLATGQSSITGELADHETRVTELEQGGGGGGGVDYSSTEQDTGLKWTDDRPVYQKTIVATVARGEYEWYYKQDLGDLGADILIEQVSFLNVSGVIVPFGSATMSNQTVTGYSYYPRLESGHLIIGLPQDTPAVGNSLTITVKYVKPALTKKKAKVQLTRQEGEYYGNLC